MSYRLSFINYFSSCRRPILCSRINQMLEVGGVVRPSRVGLSFPLLRTSQLHYCGYSSQNLWLILGSPLSATPASNPSANSFCSTFNKCPASDAPLLPWPAWPKSQPSPPDFVIGSFLHYDLLSTQWPEGSF